MNKAKPGKGKSRQKPWWRSSRNRNKVWFALLPAVAVVSVLGFIGLAAQGGHGGEQPIPVGRQVEPFTLPDIVSGENVSLGDYLGKRDVVVVGYMGFF